MAAEQNKGKTGSRKKQALIDPVYQKYTKSVIRALGSTEFYEFFMDAISRADNEFQFSNRKVQKTVDLDWVDAVEETLEAFQKNRDIDAIAVVCLDGWQDVLLRGAKEYGITIEEIQRDYCQPSSFESRPSVQGLSHLFRLPLQVHL